MTTQPPTSPHPPWRRFILLCAGWGLVGLGIVGLFVPILQGVLLISAGLLLLAREYHWARKALVHLRRRFPMARKRRPPGRNGPSRSDRI